MQRHRGMREFNGFHNLNILEIVKLWSTEGKILPPKVTQQTKISELKFVVWFLVSHLEVLFPNTNYYYDLVLFIYSISFDLQMRQVFTSLLKRFLKRENSKKLPKTQVSGRSGASTQVSLTTHPVYFP